MVVHHFEFDNIKDYPPIQSCSLIGDNRTALLISADGNVVWGCFPNFDNPSSFAAILDPKAGHFRIRPTHRYLSHQRYESETNILITEMSTSVGVVRIRDFMAIASGRRLPTAELHRIIEGVTGEVELEISFAPVFLYGQSKPHYTLTENGVIAHFDDPEKKRAVLSTRLPLTVEQNQITARFTIRAGEEESVVFDWNPPEVLPVEAYRSVRRLHEARHYWIRWLERFQYFGRYREMAVRSLLTLKLLCYDPTGAIVAAPTTSLPEWIGGKRNWDYRYSWVRDSSFILCALFRSGFVEEGAAYIDWLLSQIIDETKLKILYSIRGEDEKETELSLRGYKDSKPVRIGNGAKDQFQSDIYGSLLDAVYQYDLYGGNLTAAEWSKLLEIIDLVRSKWQFPDQGIWEARNEPKHYTYSKLWAWTALDRAVKIAQRLRVKAPTDAWQQEANTIKQEIFDRSFNKTLGAFTATYDSDSLDAAVLIMPIIGFIDANDSRFVSTTEVILTQLQAGPYPLLYRYLSDDGINEKEGAFLLPSFWLAQNHALAGNIAKARETLEALIRIASPTGLYGEQYDAQTGDILGNYPQGFSHLGFLQAALEIESATAKTEET